MIEKEAFLPVLDGPDPAKWNPWGGDTCFEDLSREVLSLAIKPPSAQKYLTRVRLSLLLHPQDLLFRRDDNEWARIVGAVIDARITTGENRTNIEDAYIRLLAKLRCPDKPWFKTLGFHLVAVTSDNSQEEINFFHLLKIETERQLDCKVQGHYIHNQVSFVSMVEFFNFGLIGADLRD